MRPGGCQCGWKSVSLSGSLLADGVAGAGKEGGGAGCERGMSGLGREAWEAVRG